MDEKEELIPFSDNLASYSNRDDTVSADTVKLAVKGDKEAFTLLFQSTYRRMYQVVRHILAHDEDIYDAMQIGYAKAFRYIRTLSAPEAFVPWLSRIMENAARDVARDAHPLEDEALGEIAVPDVTDKSDRATDVRKALKELEPDKAEVLALYYYDGLKLREIAHMLGLPVSTVHSRLTAAKKQLRQLLEQRGIDRSVYSGGFATMIAVSLRALIGTDILSAAVAQKMLDEILAGQGERVSLAAHKLVKQQRDKAVLRAVSMLMLLTVCVAAITVAVLLGIPLLQDRLDTAPANGTTTAAGTTPAGTTTGQTAAGTTTTTTATTTTSVTTTTTTTTATTTATTTTTTTTTAAANAFVPDYAPGKANADGNIALNASFGTGRIAKQGDWLYYQSGELPLLMKQKTDGSEKQLIAETYVSYLNVVGDWLYYCNSGLWRIRTDGKEKELISAVNANHLRVIGNMAFYMVELPSPASTRTVYCMDLETRETAVLAEVEGFGGMVVTPKHLFYVSDTSLYVREHATGEIRCYEPAEADLSKPFVVDEASGRLYTYSRSQQPLTIVWLNHTSSGSAVHTVREVVCVEMTEEMIAQNGGLMYYTNGYFGYYNTDSLFMWQVYAADQSTNLALSGKASNMPCHGPAAFGDGYVYFLSAENELCRMKPDGTDMTVMG